MNRAEALLKASEIAAQNPMICGPCGGPLPNPECGVKRNGFTPCCIPASDSIEEAIAEALLTTHANAVREEREACARIADEQTPKNEVHDWTEVAFVRNRVSTHIAHVIRHREEPSK